MAVVKANAYGHGLVPTALALADADAFAVARLEIRLVTHLARADEPASSMTEEQVQRFVALTDRLNYQNSISNSAGIFRASPVRCDWVRPGLALYGVSPFPDQVGTDLGLQP